MNASPRGGRAPLRDIVLAATGQDVRQCMHCLMCNHRPEKGMDLLIEEIMQAAVLNDVRVLRSRTLWGSEDYLMRNPRCAAGLEIASVILALQREAELRGLTVVGDLSVAEQG